MKLTQYTDCLLRVVIFLADQRKETSKEELSDKLFIPPIVLEKILKDLISGGILQEDLNRKYTLSRKNEEIRLYDLLVISEKTLSLVPSTGDNSNTYRNSPWYATDYMIRYFYRELQKQIEMSTKALTLKSLLQVFRGNDHL